MVHTATPIIPLISDFNVKELQYLKHSKKTMIAPGQDEYTKVRVPIIDSGASDEELLYFVTILLCRYHHGMEQWRSLPTEL
jgi:hypothetical protein